MHWHIKSRLAETADNLQQVVLEAVLANRNLKTPAQIAGFLHPVHPQNISSETLGITKKVIQQLVSVVARVKKNSERVAVYGDYDCDGIAATAILWEALFQLGVKADPFIPHREHHGYGLSIAGIDEVIDKYHPSLLITVDNGIVAHKAAEYLQDKKIDLIITDHHQKTDTLPIAQVVVHNDTVCGAVVAWVVGKALLQALSPKKVAPFIEATMDLACLGTVADLMPLTDVNRSMVAFGLKAITKADRPGIVALKTEAGIPDDTDITTYHVGFVIAPRINAMGRLAHGMDALRLLCTRSSQKANQLARVLGDTNRSRQDLTAELFNIADQYVQVQDEKIIVVSHSDFHEGIIGLIAGKLTEKYHRPAIVIAQNDSISKASARSIPGVNIVELIRTHQQLLVNAGGHPGAAGFSINTEMIDIFTTEIKKTALQVIDDSLLQPSIEIDCEIPLTIVDLDLYKLLDQLAPFGVANPTPIFASIAKIIDIKTVGKDNNHLRLRLAGDTSNQSLTAIGFGWGNKADQLHVGDEIRVAYNLNYNQWNGRTEIQLFIKDII